MDKSIFMRCVDFILPPRCLACPTVVTQQGSLCATCWQKIEFITAPYCYSCGVPFEFDYHLPLLFYAGIV